MNLKTTISILFVLLSFTWANAQSKELIIKSNNKKKLAKEAEHAYEIGDVFVAKSYYEKLVLIEPKNEEFAFKLASCQMMARNYAEAEILFKKIYTNNPDENPIAFYYYALMQKANGKYVDAQYNFTKFGKLSRKLEDKSWRKKYKNELAGCELAISLKDSFELFDVKHLEGEVNHPHIEFSPIPLPNGELVYGSNKTDDVLFYKVKDNDLKDDKIKKAPVRKLYLAKERNGKWMSEGEWEGPFNDENTHAGNGAFSLDGSRFYFTKCQKNDKNKTICKIYYTEKESDSWSKAVELDENINFPGATNTQPTVGLESQRGREVLYFVSDRAGGKGGWDIWYSIYNKKKKTFSTPKNAGRKINTAGTECTPYYHPLTGDFYFSSDGRPSVGGLDVFKVVGEKTKWEESKNVGFPVNSSADDLDFILNEDAELGFFVSNRKGGLALDNETCCDDIYSFSMVKDFEINLSLKIKNTEDDKKIEKANVKLYVRENGDETLLEEKEITNGTFNSTVKKGKEYWIEVSKNDFEMSGVTVDTRGVVTSKDIKKEIGITKKEVVVITKPKPKPKPNNKPKPKPEPIVTEEPIVLEDIYFEFNSAKLTKESTYIIDDILMTFLNKRKRAIVLIGAHTDSKGSDSYNIDLSQRRAQSVVNYLISKGINRKRLRAQGFGENTPRVADRDENGKYIPAAAKINRRVEFSVVGKL